MGVTRTTVTCLIFTSIFLKIVTTDLFEGEDRVTGTLRIVQDHTRKSKSQFKEARISTRENVDHSEKYIPSKIKDIVFQMSNIEKYPRDKTGRVLYGNIRNYRVGLMRVTENINQRREKSPNSLKTELDQSNLILIKKRSAITTGESGWRKRTFVRTPRRHVRLSNGELRSLKFIDNNPKERYSGEIVREDVSIRPLSRIFANRKRGKFQIARRQEGRELHRKVTPVGRRSIDLTETRNNKDSKYARTDQKVFGSTLRRSRNFSRKDDVVRFREKKESRQQWLNKATTKKEFLINPSEKARSIRMSFRKIFSFYEPRNLGNNRRLKRDATRIGTRLKTRLNEYSKAMGSSTIRTKLMGIRGTTFRDVIEHGLILRKHHRRQRTVNNIRRIVKNSIRANLKGETEMKSEDSSDKVREMVSRTSRNSYLRARQKVKTNQRKDYFVEAFEPDMKEYVAYGQIYKSLTTRNKGMFPNKEELSVTKSSQTGIPEEARKRSTNFVRNIRTNPKKNGNGDNLLNPRQKRNLAQRRNQGTTATKNSEQNFSRNQHSNRRQNVNRIYSLITEYPVRDLTRQSRNFWNGKSLISLKERNVRFRRDSMSATANAFGQTRKVNKRSTKTINTGNAKIERRNSVESPNSFFFTDQFQPKLFSKHNFNSEFRKTRIILHLKSNVRKQSNVWSYPYIINSHTRKEGASEFDIKINLISRLRARGNIGRRRNIKNSTSNLFTYERTLTYNLKQNFLKETIFSNLQLKKLAKSRASIRKIKFDSNAVGNSHHTLTTIQRRKYIKSTVSGSVNRIISQYSEKSSTRVLSIQSGNKSRQTKKNRENIISFRRITASGNMQRRHYTREVRGSNLVKVLEPIRIDTRSEKRFDGIRTNSESNYDLMAAADITKNQIQTIVDPGDTGCYSQETPKLTEYSHSETTKNSKITSIDQISELNFKNPTEPIYNSKFLSIDFSMTCNTRYGQCDAALKPKLSLSSGENQEITMTDLYSKSQISSDVWSPLKYLIKAKLNGIMYFMNSLLATMIIIELSERRGKYVQSGCTEKFKSFFAPTAY